MSEYGPAVDAGEHGSLDPRRWRALAMLGSAFFMVILDATIVLTAIPSMQEDLGSSVSLLQWVLTGYTVAFGGLMLFFGRIADLKGRRRVFMVGVVLFVLTSALCGLAWSAEVLIAGRVLQGVSAAIMAPTALSIVVTTFTDPTERNKALGIWGGLGGVGATAGLLLGGVITSLLGWQWIFFINLPIGLAILALCPVLVSESRDRASRRFDLAGALTITAGISLLLVGIVMGPEVGWASLQTALTMVAAVALLVAFVIIEGRSADPLVPLRIFRIRSVVSGNVGILAVGMAVDAMLFPLALYTQQILGFSALQFGLASAVMTVMSIAGAFAGQALVTKLGLRPVGAAAMILIAGGSLLLVPVSVGGSFASDILLGLLVFGPGMGAAFVAAQITALTGVSEEDSGLAAGLFETSFNIGSALGIAIATSAAVSVTSAIVAQDALVDGTTAVNAGLQIAFLAAAAFAVVGLVAALAFPRSSAQPQAEDPAEISGDPVSS